MGIDLPRRERVEALQQVDPMPERKSSGHMQCPVTVIGRTQSKFSICFIKVLSVWLKFL